MRKNILTKYFTVPGKLGICINCNHKNCQNCSMGTFSGTIHKFASEQVQKISPFNSDFRYIRFKAIGALETDGPNMNFDAFPYEEFLNTEEGYGYTSFVGKCAFIEHQSDDISKSIGTLLGAYLNRFDTSKYGRDWNDLNSNEHIDILNNRLPEEDGSVEVLMAVDSHLSPTVARLVDTGNEVGCSMGVNISHSTCSVCGAKARTELEYCFVPETLILLEDGTTKKIKDIQVGEVVITHEGRAKKVTHIYERTINENILNIVYRRKNYLSLNVTKNHPFLVSRNKDVMCDHWYEASPETQYCKQGSLQWCKTYNCFSKEIKKEFVSAEGITTTDFLVTPKTTKINSVDLSKKFAKLLGIFIAEGSYLRQGPSGRLSSICFCIGYNEFNTLGSEIVSLCKELFNKECFIEKRLNPETKNISSYDIRCHSTEVAEKFYSLVGKGAKTKKLSLELMYAPLDVQLELLKGWFLGDGCFSRKVIVTASKDLADQLVFLLARQGFMTSAMPVNNQFGFAKHIENNIIYRVPISDGFIKGKLFGEDITKNFRFCETPEEFLQQVSDIKEVPYEGKVYNLEVEDDNSYVANGVAVHNCNHVAYSKGSTVLVPANQIRNLLKEGKLRPEWIKWVLKREADQREVLSGKTSRMVTATVFEINYGLSFFELSVVANPAYIRGYKLEKIASMLKKGFQELLPLVKVAEGEEVEVHVDVTNDYFNSSTAKKAKEYNKDFKDWSDLEKYEYLRDGEIAKEALTSKQIKKVYVETENRSKLEKVGAKFVPMDGTTFVQLTNPEILLGLKFALKEDIMKFGAMEYKNTGLDLTDVLAFDILVSQQGKQPQELVDNMYEQAGGDEKKLRVINDWVKMLQTKYKVVPREYKLEKKEIKNIEEGEKGMVEKKKVPEGQKEAMFISNLAKEAQVKVPKEVAEGIEAVRDSGATNMLMRPEVIRLCRKMGYDEAADWITNNKGEYARLVFEGLEIEASKKAVYDGLPSTAEDIKDEGIDIEKTEIKSWKEMSEKGDKMTEKEKKSRAPGVIFLEDAVSAAKVVRDTKKAVQGLKGQVKNALEILAGELPPGLKEYMEKKKLEKGEKEPEERPMEAKDEEREKPFEKPKEEKPELKPGEKKFEEKKPENVKEVLQNAVTDLKEVHEDLEKIEEKLEGEAEKPLASVLKGNKRYGRHLQFAVEEALREAKPVIEDAQEAVEEAEKIITDTIKDLEKVEKPKEFGKEREPEKPKEEEKFKEKDEGGENVAKKIEDVIAGAESIKKASDQLSKIFDKEATSFPPTGARDSGDYGEPPVAKELSTWKGFNQEYEKMKGKERRTEFDTPEGRVDLLTGVVARLFVNREKRGDAYWLVTKEGSNFAMKSTFADVAGSDNLTEENFKKFCSSSYKLLILKTVSNKGLDDTRREMFGSWVKVKKTAAPFEGKEIINAPKGLYDSHEGEKDSGKARPGVEAVDAPKVAGDRKYYSEAFGDSGYAGELTKAKVASIVKENENLRKKVKALEEDRIAEALAKRAVDLARKAAAAGVIPFDAESVTEKAQEYSELDDRGFKAVEDTLNVLPVVNAKALKAYQIPEAENVNSGVVYDATESVRDEKEGKHPDLLKIDNMKDDVESAAKLSKKADFLEEEEVIPPVQERSRFERPAIVEEEETTEEELTADVKERIRKKASIVPQLSKHTADLESGNRVPDFSGRFTTIQNTLRKKGIEYAPKVHYYKR